MGSFLEIRGLTTKVAGFTILNNLDFDMEQNELRVLLGPNGAGKTTLIAMITGQYKPLSGTIHFEGKDITGLPPDHIFEAGISRSLTGRFAGRQLVLVRDASAHGGGPEDDLTAIEVVRRIGKGRTEIGGHCVWTAEDLVVHLRLAGAPVLHLLIARDGIDEHGHRPDRSR